MDCMIRKWRISDRERLAEMLNNPKVLDNLRDGLPYPYTPADGEEYIRSMLAADETKTFAFAITVDDAVIGSIGVFRGENIHSRTAELGYYIGEPYWGKGYAASAVKQVSMCLRIPTSSGSLPSPSPIMRPPAGCWRRRAFSWRAFCAAMR